MKSTEGKGRSKENNQDRKTQHDGDRRTTNFFTQYGIDSTAPNLKRGMDKRSPTEDGQAKKPSFFQVDTTFSTGSAHRTLAQQTQGTPQDDTIARLHNARKQYIELVRKQDTEERKAAQEEEQRKAATQAELKRRSMERHKLIHGNHNQDDSDIGQQGTSDEESEDDKIIGDTGKGIEGDVKSCTSLRDTSDEEPDEASVNDRWDKESQGGSDNDNNDDGKVEETIEDGPTEQARKNATRNQEEDISLVQGKDRTKPPKEKVQHSRRTQQTTLSFGSDTSINRNTPQSTESEKSSQQSSTSLLTQPQTPPRYKAVNAKSTNRRQCIRMDLTEAGDKTPESNNKARYVHKHETRVTLKMSISGTDEPFQKVKETVMEFLKEASQIDDKIMLLNWYENGKSPPIGPNSKMPPTVTATHKYIHRLFTPKLGQDTVIYPHLRLGHDIEFHTLREEHRPDV